MRKKFLPVVLTGVAVIALAVGTIQWRFHSITKELEAHRVENTEFSHTRNWTIAGFADKRIHEEILVDGNFIKFRFLSRSLSGRARLVIRDARGEPVFEISGRHIEEDVTIPLKQGGLYTMDLLFRNFFGGAAFFYHGFVVRTELPDQRFQWVERRPEEGFHWDYILFAPSSVTSPYLMVLPNNTGKNTDNIVFHEEKAKGLIIGESALAEALGCAALVPVFPRSDNTLYTHALDRNTLMTDQTELERLDLQLIAMAEHARRKLAAQGTSLEDRFLICGFSAAGSFADRFSLLHPDRVRAAVIGGTEVMLPLDKYKGEPLPYPIGTFDAAELTGRAFYGETFRRMDRFLYQGARDEGGWWTDEETGQRWTGKEYFREFTEPEILASLDSKSGPLFSGALLTARQQQEIRYRIFDGRTFTEDFAAAREVFAQLDYKNHLFRLYPATGHEKTEQIRQDQREFLEGVMREDSSGQPAK